MVAIRILCLLFCGCFVNVSSQSTVDETSSLCAWNNEQFMLQIFDRTCGRSQQLLKEMKQSMDSMSAQMMTIKGPTEGNVDEKRQLVSALTGRCIPLLIQQNVDGSDFFNRSWEEFKVGFNDSSGNYWLGNELLSQLTLTGRGYKLRFDLQSRANLSWYYAAEYSSFLVLPEQSNYTISVSGYSGNAGYDAFGYHNGMMFTTYDRDNDKWNTTNCAVNRGGGFWYNFCAYCRVTCMRGSHGDFSWNTLALQSSRMWLTCP